MQWPWNAHFDAVLKAPIQKYVQIFDHLSMFSFNPLFLNHLLIHFLTTSHFSPLFINPRAVLLLFWLLIAFYFLCSFFFKIFSCKNTFAYSSESVFIILFLCIFLFAAELLISKTLFFFLSHYSYFSLSPYSSKKVWLLPSTYDCFLSSSGVCTRFLHCLIFLFDSLSIIYSSPLLEVPPQNYFLSRIFYI